MTEEGLKLEKIRIIASSRQKAFQEHPKIFVFWDRLGTILNIIFWLGIWFIIAQCVCDGCVI